MPSWKKVIVSGSDATLNSLNVTNGVTGSLFGTASYSTSASQAITSSYSNYALTASNSQNAQDVLIYVKNTTGAQINKGTVVRISGATGDNALISTASYESDSISANTLGITNQNIPNDNFGYVITEGTLIGINTNAFSAGQLLYLGANGTITGSAPQAPLHAVRLGQVLRVQINNGSMYVRIDNGYELGELHDVLDTTTTSSYGDLLVKSGSVWINSRQLTGSYGLTGSLQATSFTGSLFGTSSYATSASQAISSSRSISSSFATLAATATTANSSTNTQAVIITDTTSGTGPYYLTFVDNTSGERAVRVDSGQLTFNATSNTLTVTNLTGTSSYATSASQAISSSFVNTLNQNIIVTGSAAIGATSGASENTLTLGARDNGSEGGQLGFNAPGGVYTSASMLDNYQNRFRILRGTNAGSDAEIAWWSMHTKQMALPAYTGSGAFPGTTTGILGVDSSGNIITTTAGGTGTVTQVNTSGTVNGLTLTGGPIISTGTITLGGTLSNILTSSLAQSGSTIGSTFVGLGSTVTTLAGLSSVTSTNFTGTASYATSASQAISSSFAINASSSLFAVSSSRAVSSSFATLAASATSATNASTVSITGDISSTAFTLPLILGTAGTGQTLYVDSTPALLYTPSTNLFYAANITATGSLLGTASYATSASQAISSSFATTAQSVLGTITNASTASNITPAITNAADNRVLTANGGGTINGEQNLTFDGSTLIVVGKLENGDSGCVASGNESHAEGRGTLSKGDHSHAEGYGTTSDGIYSHAEGYETYAGINAHSEGYITSASGVASHTEGSGSRATGVASHAEGYITLAAGFGSHAEGDDTKAIGNYSHAEGRRTSASNYWDHAEGEGTIASGIASHAEGYGSLSTAVYAHAEGYQSFAGGQASHAEGNQTSASNSYAHSEGWRTQARGMAAHSEGQYTTASGDSTHAEGDTTLAIGQASHAEGSNTISVGIASHAAGYYTSASGNYQSVIGQYNIPIATDSTFIIGNGTGVGARSNLLYASGSQVQITGSLVVTGGITGSFSGTTTSASYANIASSSLFATSASQASNAVLAINAINSTNATNVAVTDTTSGTGPYYLMFADGTTGNRAARVDSSTLTFNATTNTLTVANLTGNASTATTASFATLAASATSTPSASMAVAVGINDNPSSGGGPFYVPFVASATGNATIQVDSSQFTYAPNTNTITVANLTGTSSYATTSSRALIANSATSATSAGSVTNAVTFNNGGAGDASGTTFNGSAARTISYNTVGALPSGLSQQGGKSYVTHDFNSYPNIYDTTFINPVGSSNLPTNMSSVMSYRFIMGGGDTAARGVDLVVAAEGSGNMYMRERSIGTWSRMLHSNNYNSYSPTLTGTGASGTWGIGISGNAATATSASMASTVSITNQDTTPVTYYLTFVGQTSGNASLAVDSTTLTYYPNDGTFTAPIVNSATAVRGGNGSASAPAFSFSGDTNTGMYNLAADTIGFATNGQFVASLTSSGFYLTSSGTKTLEIGAGSAGDTNLVFTPNSTGGTGGNINVNHASLPLIFKLNSVERARITNGGAMGLGVTPTNTAGRFEASNDVVAYSSSDKNWKKNIKNIDSPLEKLSQINGVEFDWIEDEPIHGNKGHDIGVIAQEIEQILPEIVQTRESGMKAVQYDKIIPLLIESIKEQQKQIDELKELVNKLTK